MRFKAKIWVSKFGILMVNFYKNADSEKLQKSFFTKNHRKTLE